jgi:hypothetical protein
MNSRINKMQLSTSELKVWKGRQKKLHTLINQLSAEQKASCWLYGVLGNYRRYTADTIYIGADKDHDNPDS